MAGDKRQSRAGGRAALAAQPFDADAASGGAFTEVLRKLAAAFEEEREAGRFFLFLPVAAIGGVLLFFSADRDPSLLAALAAVAACSALVYLCRDRPVGFPLSIAVLALAAGFLSAAVRTEFVVAPVLEKPTRGIAVGLIETVEPRARGVRIVIRPEQMGSLPQEALPRRIRVTVPRTEGLLAGQRVSVNALWRPPPPSVRPGGYDFAREAFFRQLGAVGSDAEKPRVLPVENISFGARLAAATDNLRNTITARIKSVVSGDEGAIAAALVTGQRGEISNAANDALRVAGLFHVISISGLHMALFGGTLFAAVRFGLMLIPGIGLRYPIKKWAAGTALAGAAAYLALSGADVAAQRSFLMIAVIFLAIIFDRQGLTMRNLALAALVTILLMPETVLGPSFQMSFCAVMAIVAWYERVSARTPDDEKTKRPGALRFVHVYFGGIVATTIAATIATAPFSTFHFQRFAVHSLPGNLIALPIVSLLVMPWVLVGMILLPFGLDAFAWKIMGFGIGIMLDVSYWIETWPYATLATPAFSGLAVLLLGIGLVWLCILTTNLRWIGLAPAAFGAFLAMSPERPDIYVEAGGRAAAVRGEDGQMAVIGVRFASFAAQNWLAADGDLRSPRAATGDVRCDAFGCTAPLQNGGYLSLVWTYAGIAEDCLRARILVTRLLAPPECRKTTLVLDGADLAEKGAMTLTRRADGSYAITDARGSSQRIWHGAQSPPNGPLFKPASNETGPAEGEPDVLADDETAAAPEEVVEPQ